MNPAHPLSATVEQLLQAISQQFPSLSKQLKRIAQDVELRREHLALDGVQDVAARCNVQPSAVIRFAKHFGFSGFSEMQKVFRDGMAQQIAPTRSYQDRIRQAIASHEGPGSTAEIAQEFLGASIAGMQELQRSLDAQAMDAAVDLLLASDSVWIAGSRRSFAVAAYLDYALQHTGKPIHLLTGLGGMQEGQLRALRPGDVLVAISFAPYAEETQLAAQAAVERGAHLLAITDSRMSPTARIASASLLVQENSTMGFRALTSTMALVQSMFIALACRLELSQQDRGPPARKTA